MKRHNEAELLAPAGSFDCVRAAVNAGADAIYMGGRLFGARAYAESATSDEDELIKAIDYCHLYGVKVYMTVNTLLKDAETEELCAYLSPYEERGVDGVIVQDMGVLSLIRKNFPSLPIHASTQMTVTGPYYAKLLKELGVVRVVTPRELSLTEIKRIRDEAGIEIEAFIHGALCYAYSGQCLMSSIIGGRSGNRGRCAGPCRLPYEVYDENMRRLGRENERYVLSLKDLCTIEYLPRMINAGVYSMKIEGRMKSPVYVAGVTSVYRKYIDRALRILSENPGEEPPLIIPDREDLRILNEVFDRGGETDGYLREHNGRDMVSLKEKNERRIPDESVIKDIRESFLDRDKKIPLAAEIRGRAGERLSLSFIYDLKGLRIKATVFSEDLLETAKNRAVSPDEIRERVSKLGNTCFYVESIDSDLEDGLFIPVKQINDIRRRATDEITEKILESRR